MKHLTEHIAHGTVAVGEAYNFRNKLVIALSQPIYRLGQTPYSRDGWTIRIHHPKDGPGELEVFRAKSQPPRTTEK